jgi:hypothetical protein
MCLGHALGGVRGTYDRFAYIEEKTGAFEALAVLIERLCAVMPMRPRQFARTDQRSRSPSSANHLPACVGDYEPQQTE